MTRYTRVTFADMPIGTQFRTTPTTTANWTSTNA